MHRGLLCCTCSASKRSLEYLLSKARDILRDDLVQRIVKNSGIIISGNTIASVLNMVSFTIAANQLGPEVLAILVLAQTYALIVNDIFNVQTWESMVKFGSAKGSNDDLGNTIKTNLVLDGVSAMIAFVFALVLAAPVSSLLGWDSAYLNVILVYSLSIIVNLTSFTIGIPRLFGRFLAIAKINVTVAALKLAAIFIVMKFWNTLLSYVYIFLCAEILVNLLLIIYSVLLVNREIGNRWWKGRMSLDMEQLRFIWWTNLRTVIRIPVRHFDMIVISSVMSMTSVGIYKVYKEIAGMINRIGEPVNQAIFPEFTNLIGKRDLVKAKNITRKTTMMLTGLGIVITLIMLGVSEYLVGTFFGKDYTSQISVLYLMLFLYGISFAIVPVNSLFIAAGFAKYSFLLVLFTNTVYLIVAYSCGLVMGIYGIVLAYAVQMGLNQGLKVLLLRKYSNEWGTVVR